MLRTENVAVQNGCALLEQNCVNLLNKSILITSTSFQIQDFKHKAAKIFHIFK